MKWNNLKQNKCPKCNKAFGHQAYAEPSVIKCPNDKCDFKISHKKFGEISRKTVVKGLDYDNGLQNPTKRD